MSTTTSNSYETPRLVSEYLLFHYGQPEDQLPPNAPQGMAAALNFAVRTTRHFSTHTVARTLDLGCAVGRSTYELSRHSSSTIGIDFSHAFIDAAQRIAHSPLHGTRLIEGHLHHPFTAKLPAGLPANPVAFEVGDAMHLRPDLGTFDRVHAANLLCRLPQPQLLLQRLPSLVCPGGELVLATPCTWLEEYTPTENWPAPATFEWLRHHLDPHFTLTHTSEESFLIRETDRKFQWTTSLLTHWQRHSTP